MTASGHTGDYLPLLPARGQARKDGWPDEISRSVLRRLSLSLLLFLKCWLRLLLLQEELFLSALPSVVQDLARFFLSLSRSSSLGAVSGVAGVAAPTAGSGFSCAFRLLQLVQSLLVLRLRYLLELVILLLPVAVPGVPGPLQRQVDSRSRGRQRRSPSGGFDRREESQVAVSSTCAFFSSSGEVLPVFLGFSRLWIQFSSAHFWSLLHWRRLSVVLPASAVDCCLSSLRAGVCSLLWHWRISARVLMVACLPLLRVGRTAPSPVPLMLVASTGFPVNPGLF